VKQPVMIGTISVIAFTAILLVLTYYTVRGVRKISYGTVLKGKPPIRTVGTTLRKGEQQEQEPEPETECPATCTEQDNNSTCNQQGGKSVQQNQDSG